MSMLKNAGQFLFDEVVYNGHLQTWGVIALVVLAGQLLGTPLSASLLVAVYALFYLIYLHDRYQGVDLDALGNARRSRHLRKIYRFVPAVLVGGLLALALFLYAFGNVYALAFAAAIALGGFLYPVYFKKLTKRIPAFKNLYVALVFALMLFFPNVYALVPLGGVATLALTLAVFVFLRGLTMQFFLDLKDVDGDRAEGLRTLPVLFGAENTAAVIRVMNAGTALLLPALYLAFPSLLPLPALMLVCVAFADAYFLRLVARGNAAGFLLESAEFVYWPFLVYIGQILFR